MKIIINNCYSNVQISASINHRFSQSSVSFRESLYEYDKKKSRRSLYARQISFVTPAEILYFSRFKRCFCFSGAFP